jgi:hypothetical protein
MVFNRPNHTDYYDDENLMTIVDYQTPRREEDISHQNADKSVAIATSSGSSSRVVEDRLFVTERFGPIKLETDQIFTPMSYIEAGELVSIEVVTDNPYLQVYLELDDYKNKEPKGITPAELITRGRSEYSERHFYVEDRGTDGDYVMKYHPRKADVYKERIQIILSNSIKKTSMLYGAGFTYLARGGLPAPATLPFKGGGTFESPGMNSVNLDTIQAAIARPIGTEAYAAPNTYNASALTDMLLDVATLHPYLGEAGKPNLAIEPGVNTAVHRAVFFPPGVQATSTSGAATINTSAYPGSESATSQQQIMVYADATEVETVATGALATLNATTNNLYVRDGSKVHFPGNIVSIQRYNTGTSAFITFTGANGDGAYLITVSPGLNYTPDKVVLGNMSIDTTRSSTKALGVVTPANTKPVIVIREVIVRRKKQKSLVG